MAQMGILSRLIKDDIDPFYQENQLGERHSRGIGMPLECLPTRHIRSQQQGRLRRIVSQGSENGLWQLCDPARRGSSRAS